MDDLHAASLSADPGDAASPENGHSGIDGLTDSIAGLSQRLAEVDLEELRADVEDSIRARPLLSIGLAALAGFLVGRLLRD